MAPAARHDAEGRTVPALIPGAGNFFNGLGIGMLEGMFGSIMGASGTDRQLEAWMEQYGYVQTDSLEYRLAREGYLIALDMVIPTPPGTTLLARRGAQWLAEAGGEALQGFVAGMRRRGCSSFVAGTPVLMADGSDKPIEEVQIGDLVLATDPDTGVTVPRPVIATRSSHGTKTLVEITVDTETQVPAGELNDSDLRLLERQPPPGPVVVGETIIATDNHPFWVPEQEAWLHAGELQPGMWLLSSEGTLSQVTDTRTWTQPETVHNLTVDGLHTYHVVAGGTDMLVHNRRDWTIRPDRSTDVRRGGPFGEKYYQQAPDANGTQYWWSRDRAGHGGSEWKVYTESSRGLDWHADADRYGNFIRNKYKGNTGIFIPWRNLRSC